MQIVCCNFLFGYLRLHTISDCDLFFICSIFEKPELAALLGVIDHYLVILNFNPTHTFLLSGKKIPDCKFRNGYRGKFSAGMILSNVQFRMKRVRTESSLRKPKYKPCSSHYWV
jgi:hypothetical protein